MHHLDEAFNVVHELVDRDANIIFGDVLDNEMKEAVRVTIIATGLASPEAAPSKGVLAYMRGSGRGAMP